MRIVHCRKAPFDTYIGRANKDLPKSKWANPWVIGRDGTREEVIDAYEQWVRQKPELMAALPELKDKVMGCWCKTEANSDIPCHGDVLLKLLREMGIEQEEPVKINEILPEGSNGDLLPKDDKRDILGLWTSFYSIGSSILTLEEAGKTKDGGPDSICDIAKANGLKQITLVEDRIDGFLEAYRHLSKIGVQLVYGLRLTVVPDMSLRTDDSHRQESRVIIFIRNSQGYSDILKLWNRCWVDGYYAPPRESGYGRIDWHTLAQYWTPNLILALPYFSSFLAKNLLTFSSIVPKFPVPVSDILLMKEVDSGIPFSNIIDEAVLRFATDSGARVQCVKSIYYKNKESFDAYVTYRAIVNGGRFSRPEIPNLCSDRFCFTEWQRLTKGEV